MRVCLNIISNAVSAMPEGGSLSLKTDENKRDGNMEISIADTGEGIPAEKKMNEKLSILLVEDDAEMRETLGDILLDKKDYVVKAVGTGKEGLAIAKEEKFHICLIDLKLPDITGIEVLKGLKAINPRTYAIIITVYASKETAIEALKTGAYCYLEKPLDMEELFVTLERISVAYQLREDKIRAEDWIKASLKEKEVLLREVHHRVKNNFQVVSSLLNMQARQITDKHTFELFKISQNRIKTMALIHAELYQFEDLARIDFAKYIRKLVTNLYNSYGVDFETIKLKMRMCIIIYPIVQVAFPFRDQLVQKR